VFYYEEKREKKRKKKHIPPPPRVAIKLAISFAISNWVRNFYMQ